jgi:hypothetical protein
LESVVKQGLGIGGALLLAALFSGCATQPGMVAIGDISNLPQTTLPGAELEYARALAMGTARSKGWSITEAAPNRLLLERELRRDSPQAQALGLGESATAPRIQVQTDLVERRDGVVVALRSIIVANPGTEGERRIDYTADYENELTISLSALQTAWLDHQRKVASEVPLPNAEVAAAQAADNAPDAAAEAAAAAVAEGSPPAAQPEPRPEPVRAPPVSPSSDVVVRAAAPEPEPEPLGTVADATPSAPGATTASRLPAPSGVGLPATTTPAIPAPAAAPAGGNDMLVLNAGARKGLWAYYAEDYARLRGCALSELGAVLLQETATYELHEVHCAGSANFLLRCQGGVCQEMR